MNPPVVNTYPLSRYTYDYKGPKIERYTCFKDRVPRMKAKYEQEGMRRSVEGILMVHEHNHPHILLLKVGNRLRTLPGGRLQPGENEIEGLKRKLSSKMGPTSPLFQIDWQIGECVAIWWRPEFKSTMYPYCPPDATRPTECKKVFIVQLPERGYFEVPINYDLIAVPLLELYDNKEKYGPYLYTIPEQLCRFQFNMINV